MDLNRLAMDAAALEGARNSAVHRFVAHIHPAHLPAVMHGPGGVPHHAAGALELERLVISDLSRAIIAGVMPGSAGWVARDGAHLAVLAGPAGEVEAEAERIRRVVEEPDAGSVEAGSAA